jgi:hypothetical protein
MVTLVQRTSRQKTILPEAEELLRGRALADERAYGRSVLLHASWLALAHTRTGELDRAVHAGRHALQTGQVVVSSHRCLDLLNQLRHDITTYTGVPKVKDFIGDLDNYLCAHPV